MTKETIQKKEKDLAAKANKSLDRDHLKVTFDLCVRKTRNNIRDLADEPRTWSNEVAGRYEKFNEEFFDIGNWTSSFFTGMALLAWRGTEDEYFLKEVLRLAPSYREKVFQRFIDTHHDLGFLYTLYSVALYKLTGDLEHREVGVRAADVLSGRFNEKGSFIRAWGHMNTTEQDNMAIIDCLMNLPLLYWASKETGDAKYYDIAVQHADMCLKYFVRPDWSVNHAYRFDLQTGQPIGPDNYCGHSKDSYWSRGTAWAIYGFALSHRYTGGKQYLDTAHQLARAFINQLDSEIVPVWDFRLPKNVTPVRDASAAAVAGCAFQELEKLGIEDPLISQTKTALLNRICENDYLDATQESRGVLKNGYGDRAGFSSWGDYYLMEAVSRELGHGETWW